MQVTRHLRYLVLAAVPAALTLIAVGPAHAGTSDPISTTPAPAPPAGGDSGHGTIAAHVRLDLRHNGTARSSPVASSDPDWSPPLCWSQPKYTAAQYKAWLLGPLNTGTGPNSKAIAQKVASQTDFHTGQPGSWWFRTYDVDQLGASDVTPAQVEACDSITGQQWVRQGTPRPVRGISPGVLSGLAYQAMRLPSPPVALRPAAGQIVNFATYVGFRAPLDRVWVTASFDALGVDVAATTVATPVALRIDAGTADADPRSCTYRLTKAAAGYQVDSAHAACNVTYRKSSGAGTYPLRAQVTWQVTWSATRGPGGPAQRPALPDGLSTHEQDVTVKEIQTVVR